MDPERIQYPVCMVKRDHGDPAVEISSVDRIPGKPEKAAVRRHYYRTWFVLPSCTVYEEK